MRTLEQLRHDVANTTPGKIAIMTDAEYALYIKGENFKDLPNRLQAAKPGQAIPCSEKELSSMSAILDERGSRYGSFVGHAKITQALKKQMRMTPNWEKLSDSQKESLEMIAHKIGRILNGDPNYADSWVDICGYSQLIVDELEGKIH